MKLEGYLFNGRFYKSLDDLRGKTMSEGNEPKPVYSLEPLPNGLPDEIHRYDIDLGWNQVRETTFLEISANDESGKWIEYKDYERMRSLAEKEMIGFAEWLLEKSIKIRRDNISHWYVYQGKEYTTQQLLIKYRESCK